METFLADFSDLINEYYLKVIALIPKLIMGLVIFLFFLFIANRTRKFSKSRLTEHLDDPLLANFLSQVIRYSFITVGLFGFLSTVGLGRAATTLIAGAGLSAFIIGFAFKDIGENFLAGILMAFKRPFRIGDVVETGAVKGTIVGLTIRETQIKTFDGKDVYVPNGQVVKNTLINFTIDGYLRLDFLVGLDYGDDIPQARALILQALKQVGEILQEDKGPSVFIEDLGASTVNLRVYFWINTFDPEVSGLEAKSKAIHAVCQSLTEAGYYLPAEILEVKSYREEGMRMLK